MKWQVISDVALRLRTWDDESIVYNSLSGDIHLLGPFAAQILLQLLKASLDTASLTARLAEIFQTAPDGDLSIQVDQIVGELKALALIESA
jgi:PqqD family protein of HPr-rel-A system